MLGWDILVKGMSKQGQVITIASWSAGLGAKNQVSPRLTYHQLFFSKINTPFQLAS